MNIIIGSYIRKLSVLLIPLLILSTLTNISAFGSTQPPKSVNQAPAVNIKLNLDGTALTLSAPPVLEKDVVFVQTDSIFRSLDAFGGYDAKTKTIYARKGSVNISVTVGSTAYKINGVNTTAAAPKTINGKIYLPLDLVSKEFGYDYRWLKDTKTAEISSKAPPQLPGATFGSIANEGFLASDSEWTYLSLSNGLYKMKKDGSENKRLTDKASYLNISSDWLYFTNIENENFGSIYKIKTDGTSKTKLTNSKARFTTLYGEWIYFINISDGNKPYRVSTDGKYSQKISDFALVNMYTDNGWIYYQAEDDSNIYKMRTGGTDIRMLSENSIEYGNEIIKAGDWLYYFGREEGSVDGIWKMKTDGSGKKLVLATGSGDMNWLNGNFYFTDPNNKLYILNEEKRTFKQIGYNVSGSISLADDWIYSYNFGPGFGIISSFYRIKNDGSVKQKFDNTGKLTEVYTVDLSAEQASPVVLPKVSYTSSVKTAKEIVKNKNAVVHVKIFDEDGNELGSGSGFNIDKRGIIVTNYHVVKGAASIQCTFDNGKTYEADYFLNHNELKDIAILHLKDVTTSLPVVTLGDSDKVELADDVLAIGNPLELQNTISDGIISGVREMYGMSYIQTTAAISPGSSGGPLFNSYGYVIGITSMYLSGAQNINFAVPINAVKKLLSTARIIPIPKFNLTSSAILEFENNNGMQTANTVSLDNVIGGILSEAADIDFYKFDLAAGMKLNLLGFTGGSFGLDGTPGDIEINLLDQNGSILARSTKTTEEGGIFQKINLNLKPGTYYISVKLAGQTQTQPGSAPVYVLLAIAG